MNPYPSGSFDRMTDMAQELSQVPMTKTLAEEVARKILGGERAIQAVMIIDDLGKVLAHARAKGFDVEDQDLGDVLPRLVTFPKQGVSVFLKVSPQADQNVLYKTILGALEGYGS